MIMEAIKRCMIGIAWGGLWTFGALTVMNFTGVEASVSQIWLNMLCGLLIGIYFGLSSFVFDGNDWSILKQTVVHFVMSIIFYLIIALSIGWIPFHSWAILWTVVIFIFIYAVFWTGHYIYYKRLEESMNKDLDRNK